MCYVNWVITQASILPFKYQNPLKNNQAFISALHICLFSFFSWHCMSESFIIPCTTIFKCKANLKCCHSYKKNNCIHQSTQKQTNCKKKCGLCKKGSMKKVVKSKVAAQKWLWWSDNGKIFNNNILHSPEMLLLKFLPLSDHHSHFWAATFDFTTFFMLPFLHGPHLFFYSLAVFM